MTEQQREREFIMPVLPQQWGGGLGKWAEDAPPPTTHPPPQAGDVSKQLYGSRRERLGASLDSPGAQMRDVGWGWQPGNTAKSALR